MLLRFIFPLRHSFCWLDFLTQASNLLSWRTLGRRIIQHKARNWKNFFYLWQPDNFSGRQEVVDVVGVPEMKPGLVELPLVDVENLGPLHDARSKRCGQFGLKLKKINFKDCNKLYQRASARFVIKLFLFGQGDTRIEASSTSETWYWESCRPCYATRGQ